jgi:hypothetical protein
MVMMPLSLAANLSTEVVVVTTLVDRLVCLQTLIRMGEALKPPITGGTKLFEYLVANKVKSMFRSQVHFCWLGFDTGAASCGMLFK